MEQGEVNMYLEQRLEALEAKIDLLVSLATSKKPEPIVNTETTKAQFADNAEFANAVKGLVRAKPSIKGQVKATLSEAGYTVLADVPPADFDDVFASVKAL